MLSMIEQAKNDFHEAIYQYECLFDDDKGSMSFKRSQDVIELRGLLLVGEINLQQLLQTMQQKIDSMQTGWWIFSTGRSRLKDNVKQVIHNYQQPLVGLLFDYTRALKKGYLEQMRANAPVIKQSEDKNINLLKSLRLRVKQLKQRYNNLLDQNALLQEQLAVLSTIKKQDESSTVNSYELLTTFKR